MSEALLDGTELAKFNPGDGISSGMEKVADSKNEDSGSGVARSNSKKGRKSVVNQKKTLIRSQSKHEAMITTLTKKTAEVEMEAEMHLFAARAQEVFDLLDTTGDGYLYATEILDAMVELGMTDKAQLKSIQNICETADARGPTPGMGLINIKVFIDLMTKTSTDRTLAKVQDNFKTLTEDLIHNHKEMMRSSRIGDSQ